MTVLFLLQCSLWLCVYPPSKPPSCEGGFSLTLIGSVARTQLAPFQGGGFLREVVAIFISTTASTTHPHKNRSPSHKKTAPTIAGGGGAQTQIMLHYEKMSQLGFQNA